MPFSSVFDVDVIKSLRYSHSIGQGEISSSSAFLVDGVGTSSFIANEQAFDIIVTGLRPGTVHKAFVNGVDVTQWCKQVGSKLGAGLITKAHSTPNQRAGGELFFTFYYRSDIIPNTPVEQSASEADLLGSQKILVIKSEDGASIATIGFSLPIFAKSEPEVTIKKTPSETSIVSNLQLHSNPRASVSEQYFEPVNYSYVQTFFADKEIVQNASELFLTSVDLFFRRKPNINTSSTGNPLPGVSIAICEVDNNQPILSKTYVKSLNRKSFTEIFSYSDASTPVTFGFVEPIKLVTDRFYGIVIIFEDPAYDLWVNKVGDKLVGTNVASTGVNSNKDGNLFVRNNSNIYNSLSDTDLKFNIRAAKFTSQSEVKTFIPENYEFLTVDTKLGNFVGGESVYKERTAEAGTISINTSSRTVIGSGTAFTQLSDGEVFVVTNGPGVGNTHLAVIEDVANDTFMTITSTLPYTNSSALYTRTCTGKIYYQDMTNRKIFLTNSTADLIKFEANNTIIGAVSGASANIVSVDNLSIDRARIKGDVSIPSFGDVEFKLVGTNFDGSTYSFNSSNFTKIGPNSLLINNITNYDSHILSRSNELLLDSLFTDTNIFVNKKSLKIEAAMNSTGNQYMSPSISKSQLNLMVAQNSISNTTLIDISGVSYDSEVSNSGTSKSRHIGKKITFEADRKAEDLRIFMTAYRPLGTDIKVYAKIFNSSDSEAFDDKVWTPLEYVTNKNSFSSSEDDANFIEFQLGLPDFSEAIETSLVPFTSAGNGNLIVTDSTRLNPSTFVESGSIIRVFDPVFGGYEVHPVQSANSTYITLASPLDGTTLATTALSVDKLKYPNIAFNNLSNDNISRYFNSRGSSYDGFDTMQIKIVFTATNTYLVPKVDQIQVLGVSA